MTSELENLTPSHHNKRQGEGNLGQGSAVKGKAGEMKGGGKGRVNTMRKGRQMTVWMGGTVRGGEDLDEEGVRIIRKENSSERGGRRGKTEQGRRRKNRMRRRKGRNKRTKRTETCNKKTGNRKEGG